MSARRSITQLINEEEEQGRIREGNPCVYIWLASSSLGLRREERWRRGGVIDSVLDHEICARRSKCHSDGESSKGASGKADWLAVVMPDGAAFRRGGTNGAMQVEGRDMKG